LSKEDKVKRTQDDSDEEKGEESIVWGRSRYSQEEGRVNERNNNSNQTKDKMGDENENKKKIFSKNTWHGD